MDLSFSQEDRDFQQDVQSFLETAWPQEMRDKKARSALGKLSKDDLVGWQKRLAEKGWAAVNWPKEHGGAAFTPTQSYIWDLERAKVGAPGVIPFGMSMVAPVIMKFGTDEQKAKKLATDYKKRKENWKETPASYLKHSVHSAKAETRSNRHTVLGMDIAEAEAAALTNRPNKKVDY